MSTQELPLRCQDHPNNILVRFCSTCTKSACMDCEHFMTCYTAKHDTKPMKTAAAAFSKIVTEVITSATDIKEELETILSSLSKDGMEFKLQANEIKQQIENHIKAVVRNVQQEGEKLMVAFDILCKQKEKAFSVQLNELESNRMELQSLKETVAEMENKPQNIIMLSYYKLDIKQMKQSINTMKNKCFSHENNLAPNFSANTDLDDAILKGLGKITTIDKTYSVIEGDTSITVTKGQSFAVRVENVDESDACALTATLIKPSRDEIAVDEVGYMENGKYEIRGRCNEEGAWKMEINNGIASIKGSPVNIMVVPTLVHTIENIGFLITDNKCKVTDVESDKDGSILVSSCANELLRFNQSGSVGNKLNVRNVQVYKILQMENGCIMFSDANKKKVIMCNEKLEVITKFGKGILKCPAGLAVNNERRIVYVADRKAHCVYQFNIGDETLIGKIGLSKLITPHDVTLTKEGNILVPDWSTDKVQMFNANGKFIKTFVDEGEEDGKVWNPRCIVMDENENVIVSSEHKLQLFDKNGIFLKRIDTINDKIDTPDGITVISNKPRRLAVANHGANNVKIFNY